MHLTFEPSHQQINNLLLLPLIQLHAFRHLVPLLEAAPAAAGAGVLREEHRMAAHRSLLSVVGDNGRCEPLPDEVLRVAANGVQAFLPHIRFVLFF